MIMEWIERYIYAVTKRLPESQREDVASELRSLIEDMLDERKQSEAATAQEIEEVLMELGHPSLLAQKYRGKDRVLIGPELYDLYMIVLKISLISTGVVAAAVFVLQSILHPVQILDHFIDFNISIFTVLPMAFGWTTFGFALAQHFGSSQLKTINLNKEWRPADLPKVPDLKHRTNRRDAIAGMVFHVLFVVILVFSADYLGIWLFQDGEFAGVIPFMNPSSYYYLFFILVFVLGFVKECLKFVSERWTWQLIAAQFVLNLVSIGFVALVMTGNDFWNPHFMEQLVQHQFVTPGSSSYSTIEVIWSQVTMWILLLMVIGLLWDLAAGLLKLRHAKQNENH